MTSLPMYRHQQALPVLPLPTVEDTMRRYLAALKPVVPAETYAAAETHANAFVGSEEAARLQEHLTRHQAASPNWLERLWTDSYLMDRSSPGLHVSPVLGFDSKHVAMRLDNDGIAVGAHLCVAGLRFHLDIEAGIVEPNVVRGKPLCMEDYNWCFGTARIPCAGRDIVVKASPPRATHAHALVMCRGRPYELPLLGPGWTLSLEGAKKALAGIRRRAQEARPLRVGALTYLHRDEWATVRAQLLTNATNRLAMHQIETALFVLSLDDGAPGDDNPDTIHTLMHGHPAAAAADRSWTHLNRWWDKGVHLHTAQDGRAGLTFEHSAQDSLPILTFTNFVARRLAPAPAGAAPAEPIDGPNATATPPVGAAEIVFDESQEVLGPAVERGATHLADTLEKLNIATAAVPLSPKRFKAAGLSPDAAVQASLQVGFRAARGFTPSTYESAATKTFLHGRTETLRPLSSPMAALVDALAEVDAKARKQAKQAPLRVELAPAPDDAAVLKLFAAACKTHAESARLAASGAGCDRHLFGLLSAAQELGLEIPDVLSDTAFKAFANITLSTTHPFWQPGTRLVGFGPVISPVCVGVGYFVTPVDAMLGVSTWRQHDERADASATVAAAATRTLRLLQRVVDKAPAKASAQGKAPNAKL